MVSVGTDARVDTPDLAPLDLLVENVRIVDVVLQRVFWGWFGVRGGRFLYVEEGPAPPPGTLAAAEAHRRLDAGGLIALPGLIDTHMHIESSLLTPGRFAEAVLPWGTTTVLQDPHEVANVLRLEGVRFMLQCSRGLPLRVLSAIPSCVPATSDALESVNARIGAEEVAELAREQDVVALGELMDYQGLLSGDPRLEAILDAGRRAGLSLEGHIPTLSSMQLSRYAAYGIRSDHTLMGPEKVAEELSKGLYVMLQEKSLTPQVVDLVRKLPDRSRVLLVTDDVLPNRLAHGHLNRILERAVQLGWDPIDALASATVRPAVYLGLRDLGLIAPGYRADFLLCEALDRFPPREVYVDGVRVAEDGRPAFSAPPVALPDKLVEAGGLVPAVGGDLDVREADPVPPELFRVRGAGLGSARALVRVIRVNEVNTYTTLEERWVALRDGVPQDTEDLVMAAVIPRSALRAGRSHEPILGFVEGLHLRSGAFASSFAHDSHNLFVVGTSPQAMALAVRLVVDAGGGMAVVECGASGHRSEVLPLPIAGLLTDEPVGVVASRFDSLESALRRLGVTHKNPILLLTILPLTVSPAFKLSDRGIVDVENRRILDPVVELQPLDDGDPVRSG